MVICLFLYFMVEYQLRQALVRTGRTVISQTKKQTQRPTLKGVFFLFRRVRDYSILLNRNRVSKVAHLTDDLRKILGLLGPPYEKYYF